MWERFFSDKRLMYLASVSSCPPTPVLPTLSDPARSTRWSLERRRVAEPGSRPHKCTVKMQWERLHLPFVFFSVWAVALGILHRRCRKWLPFLIGHILPLISFL
uniref:Uncharacterized protein n=1 Tax=Myripristis murdjan TaxID=586833 RepID=A0A667Y1S1_9TELE